MEMEPSAANSNVKLALRSSIYVVIVSKMVTSRQSPDLSAAMQVQSGITSTLANVGLPGSNVNTSRSSRSLNQNHSTLPSQLRPS